MTKEEEVLKLSTRQWISLIVVLAFWAVVGTYLAGIVGYWSGLTRDEGFVAAPFLTLFAIFLASKVSKKFTVNAPLLGGVFALTIVVAQYVTLMYPYANIGWSTFMGWQDPFPATWGHLQPDIFRVDVSAVKAGLYGKAGVPWGAWGTVLGVWIVLAISMFFYTYSGTLLVRRKWLDIDNLPYPYATAAVSMIGATGETRSARRVKFMLVGALIAALFSIPGTLRLFPWGRTIPATPPLLMGAGVDLRVINPPIGDILANANIYLTFGPPWRIALVFLIPTDIQLTAAIAYIAMNIIFPPIYTALGYLKYDPKLSSLWDWYGVNWTGPKLSYVCEAGMLIGIGVWPLILAWRTYSKGVLMSLFKGPTKEEKEVEPVPYRLSWIILFATFIVILAIFSAIGTSILNAILLLVLLQVFNLGWSRSRGEAGLYFPMRGANATATVYYAAGYDKAFGAVTTMTNVNKEYYATMHLGEQIFMEWGLSTSSAGTLSLEGYKVARMHGISNRSIFTLQTLGVIIAILVSTPLCLLIAYSQGISVASGVNSGFQGYSWYISRCYPSWMQTYLPENVWPAIGAGFIVSGILMWLRLRFPWFILNPLGVVLAGSGLFIYGLWLIFLIMWVVKMAVLRFGGVKLYEEVGVPIAAGVIGMNLVFDFINAMIRTYYFYFPVPA